MLDFGFYNMDCMEGMKQFPDKYFDLAIVDPPYGDGGGTWKRADGSRFGGTFDKYRKNEGGYWNRFGQRFDRYKQTLPTEECSTARRNMGLCELEEHGRRNSQKNHYVGRCPEAGIF